MDSLSANLMLAWLAYVIATVSPGPSNLAVMAIAIRDGRKPALLFALGVVTGSLFWGAMAAFGLSALLALYSQTLTVVRISAGLYLLWLAFKSARSALRRTPAQSVDGATVTALSRYYARGAMLHLTNPKAIFAWLSIVSIALPAAAAQTDALVVVAGCGVLGLLLYSGFALAFSTSAVRRVFARAWRWLEGSFALIFGYAGLTLVFSRHQVATP